MGCGHGPNASTALVRKQQSMAPSSTHSISLIETVREREKHRTNRRPCRFQSHAIHDRRGFFSRRLPQIPLGHLLLPLLPVPRRHVDAAHAALVEASVIDIVTVRMTPRDRQRRDAAVLAEHVLGRSRSEPVDLDVLFAVEGLERGFVDDKSLEACGRWEV